MQGKDNQGKRPDRVGAGQQQQAGGFLEESSTRAATVSQDRPNPFDPPPRVPTDKPVEPEQEGGGRAK